MHAWTIPESRHKTHYSSLSVGPLSNTLHTLSLADSSGSYIYYLHI